VYEHWFICCNNSRGTQTIMTVGTPSASGKLEYTVVIKKLKKLRNVLLLWAPVIQWKLIPHKYSNWMNSVQKLLARKPLLKRPQRAVWRTACTDDREKVFLNFNDSWVVTTPHQKSWSRLTMLASKVTARGRDMDTLFFHFPIFIHVTAGQLAKQEWNNVCVSINI